MLREHAMIIHLHKPFVILQEYVHLVTFSETRLLPTISLIAGSFYFAVALHYYTTLV